MLLGSDVDQSVIKVIDKNAPMSGAELPLTTPVVVQRRSSRSSVCWESSYDAGDVRATPANEFKAITAD